MTDYGLLRWLGRPDPENGISFLGPDGAWDRYTYDRLALLARRCAWQLRAKGVRPGSVVMLVHPNSPGFVAAFFGALMLGATPAPVAPPIRFQPQDQYQQHLERLLAAGRIGFVSTTASLAARVGPAGERAGAVLVLSDDAVSTDDEVSTKEYTDGPIVPDIAVLQFSSGSTGQPRGVQVPLAALEANIDTILWWTNGRPWADAVASWIPLFHDMGLVGCLLAPASRNGNVMLMEPDQFVRAPLRWLRCFSEHGATLTAVPNFGLAHVMHRVSQEDLAEMDFTGWRALIIGSERVDAKTIDAFTRYLAPFGFSGRAVMPAYGLAEATLAVTGSRYDEEVRKVCVDPASLLPSGRVEVAASGGIEIVGCGRPFPGTGVSIVDDAGEPLHEGFIGEIEISGKNIARGYSSAANGQDQGLHGVLRTGDAGFILDGELFVVGRIGDSVKVRGRWLFAEDVDEILRTIAPRPLRCVTLLGSLDGRETAAILCEGGTQEQQTALGMAAANHLVGLRVMVVEVRRGSILRTTSGKPRRRPMWERLASERLGGVVGWDSDLAPAPRADPIVGSLPDK